MDFGGGDQVRFQRSGRAGIITLTRPKALNAVTHAMVRALTRALDAWAQDPGVAVVVVKAEGRAFSAGGDIKKALNEHQDRAWMSHMGDRLRGVLLRFEASPKLVIAVIDGWAVAGGIELMLACDMVIASDRAKFSDGHLNFSLLPGAGGTQRLPRLIGAFKAKDLFLTARTIGGEEAHAMGLVTYCVPAAELDAKLDALLADLKSKSFSSRAAIKHLVNRGAELDRASALQMEADYCLDYETAHPDAHEGMLAFAEKRKPKFLPPG